MIKRDVKLVGKITEQIASNHKISELANRPIVQSLDFYIHIAKHVKQFKNVESINKAIDNIPNVLAKPEFTYYDKEKECLLYYAKLDDYTCYAINLNLTTDYCYLASLYPISLKKLEKKKEESYIRKN